MNAKAFGFIFSLPLLIGGGIAACVSAWQLTTFFGQQMDFTVNSSYLVCEKPLNNRCERRYEVRGGDRTAFDFVPFGFEFENGTLLSGRQIEKAPFSLMYSVDGRAEMWPYLWQHILVCLLGVCGVAAWFKIGGPAMFMAWRTIKKWP